MTKEEILLNKMHKVHPKWAKLDDIFPNGKLKLLIEAMDEYYNQALENKRELLIDFTDRCLHDLIDAERGGINSEPIIDEYLKLKK